MRKAFVKGHLKLFRWQIAFRSCKTYHKHLSKSKGTHASALKQVEKQVFSTDTKVLKQVETAHNLLVNASANACPVVPRFPQNTSLKRKVQSALSTAQTENYS
jgi:hypothetical protein